MRIPRSITRYLHLFLDEYLPPTVRDSRWVMALPFRLLFGSRAPMVLDFKERAATMTDEELTAIYRSLGDLAIERETDLSPAALESVLDAIVGPTVLEVGCGTGYLARRIAAAGHDVTASDLIVSDDVRRRYPAVRFETAALPRLPWPDRSFDTVVCTHTLEHVKDIHAARDELRRLARRRLVVVLPRQRPYKYSFDLHLHFFPYAHSVTALMQGRDATCAEAQGDWVYIETIGQ